MFSSDRAIRDASSAANAKLDKHQVELASRRDVYERLAALRDGAAGASLDGVQRRLLGKMCEDYERQGVALPAEQAARLKAINQRLAEISVEFQKTLNEENQKLLFSEAELAGLSPEFVQNLPTEGEKRVVTLKYTELFPILKQCSVEATRRAVEEANSNKCPENVALMHEALTLKLEAARLLGFESESAFQLAILMAKTPANVNAFLTDLNERLSPLADKERQQLIELKKKAGGASDGKLYSHDWRYFQQQLAQLEHNVDEELIKQHFPLAHVKAEVLKLYEQLLDVKFTHIVAGTPNHRVFHPDVEQWAVTDASTGAELGTFFLDLHPREGKYGHACVMPLIPTYVTNNGTRNPQVGAMLANFSKPTKDKPSLLDHDEVTTFAHEFGHQCHGFVSTARYARFSGTSVERDFVEAVSVFLSFFFFFFAPYSLGALLFS